MTTLAIEAYSFVIPVNGEAVSLRQLIARLDELARSPRGRMEALIVDDYSSDGTAEILGELAASRPWLRIVPHSRPKGQTEAVRSGWARAESDIVVIVDGDNEYDVRHARALVEELARKDADVVVGRRIERSSGLSPSKRAFAWTLNRALPALTGLRVHDSGCGFRVVGNRGLLSAMAMRDDHRYFPHLAHIADAKVVEIPVEWTPRPESPGHYGMERFFWLPVDLLRIALEMRTGERFARRDAGRFVLGIAATVLAAWATGRSLSKRIGLR